MCGRASSSRQALLISELVGARRVLDHAGNPRGGGRGGRRNRPARAPGAPAGRSAAAADAAADQPPPAPVDSEPSFNKSPGSHLPVLRLASAAELQEQQEEEQDGGDALVAAGPAGDNELTDAENDASDTEDLENLGADPDGALGHPGAARPEDAAAAPEQRPQQQQQPPDSSTKQRVKQRRPQKQHQKQHRLELVVQSMLWGLVPSFSGQPVAAGYSTFNCRAEGAAGSPLFGRLVNRQRCVVPVDGYFEWCAGCPPTSSSAPGPGSASAARMAVVGSGGGAGATASASKQPYFVRPAPGSDPDSLLFMAGFWDRWSARPRGKDKDKGKQAAAAAVEEAQAQDPPTASAAPSGLEDHQSPPSPPDLFSFTVLTRPSTPELRWLHDRMPVLLRRSELLDWLDPEGRLGFPEAAKRFVWRPDPPPSAAAGATAEDKRQPAGNHKTEEEDRDVPPKPAAEPERAVEGEDEDVQPSLSAPTLEDWPPLLSYPVAGDLLSGRREHSRNPDTIRPLAEVQRRRLAQGLGRFFAPMGAAAGAADSGAAEAGDAQSKDYHHHGKQPKQPTAQLPRPQLLFGAAASASDIIDLVDTEPEDEDDAHRPPQRTPPPPRSPSRLPPSSPRQAAATAGSPASRKRRSAAGSSGSPGGNKRSKLAAKHDPRQLKLTGMFAPRP